MKVAFLKEEIGQPFLYGKTCSLNLFKEALKRKFEVYYFQPHELIYHHGNVLAKARRVKSIDIDSRVIKYSSHKKIDLEDMDFIVIRLDPPFDMNYLTSMHILKRLEEKVRVVNSASKIIEFPEKVIPKPLLKFCPETLITSNFEEIESFIKTNKKAIIKPLYESNGHDVFLIEKDNMHKILGEFSSRKAAYVIQQFIPEVSEGDKRVLIINGKVLPPALRVPKPSTFKANISAGGKLFPTTLTRKEQKMSEEIGSYLKKAGIFLAGIDLIGERLTEINVTAPACFTDLWDLYKFNGRGLFWDELLKSK